MRVLSLPQSQSTTTREIQARERPAVPKSSSWERSLWHTIDVSQRHPITDFHNYRRVDTVGDRIKWVRGKRKLSRPALARMAEIPYPTLAGLENSDQKTSTELPAIARALKANIEFLAKGHGEWDATKAASDTSKDGRIEGIRVSHLALATSLARSIPDAARAWRDALEKPALHDEFLQDVRAAIDAALPPLALHAPSPQAPKPTRRKDR